MSSAFNPELGGGSHIVDAGRMQFASMDPELSDAVTVSADLATYRNDEDPDIESTAVFEVSTGILALTADLATELLA